MKLSAIIFQSQSTIIVLLMLIGIFFRKRRQIHVKIMSLVIAWDVLLILQIELNRSAIAKAAEVAKNTSMLNIHVSIAVATVLLYVAMVWSGRKLLKGENHMRFHHKMLGISTLIMRLLTYATSWYVIVP